jgi:hypothetical protein
MATVRKASSDVAQEKPSVSYTFHTGQPNRASPVPGLTLNAKQREDGAERASGKRVRGQGAGRMQRIGFDQKGEYPGVDQKKPWDR